MKSILSKTYYIIIFTLVIFSLAYYLYLNNEINENLELFTNKSNTITFELYPKLDKIGNYKNLKCNVLSTTILSLDDGKYNNIVSKLKSITGQKKVSVDVTFNDNISDINKSKFNKLFVINNQDPIDNVSDKMKILDGNYIFHAEGKNINNKKTKINYEIRVSKEDFNQPYSLVKTKNNNVEINATEYVLYGKEKGGIDQINLTPIVNKPVRIILKINHYLEDVKCFLTSTYEKKIIKSYELFKVQKTVNGKIVEGFENHSDTIYDETSDDESSDDESNYQLENLYNNISTISNLWNNTIEPLSLKNKKKKKKKKKVRYYYYYVFFLNNHYEYDVDFDIIPTINNSFYELKNEENIKFDKYALDSYGSNILGNDVYKNENSSDNLYQWIKGKLSKSNNTELYSMLSNKNYENETEIGNRRKLSYKIDTSNDHPQIKTHNYKISYYYEPEIVLSNNIAIIQLEFPDNNNLKEFYNSMKNIYIGNNLLINRDNISYKNTYNSNKSKYLLFIRDDIYSKNDINTWLREYIGVSYYDKENYKVIGFNYENT